MKYTRASKIKSLIPLAAAAFLSGCVMNNSAANQSVVPDTSAHVQLDYETSQIVFPIEQYQISDPDWSIVTQAREIVLDKCMVGMGFASEPERPTPVSEDRNFGLWNVERARQYGFSIPGLETKPDDPALKPPGWGEARETCVKQEAGKLADVSPPDPSTNPNIADIIQHQSLALASKDPAWADAREEWWACLRSRGLEPRTGEQDWSSKQALDLAIRSSSNDSASTTNEEGIRIATLEADCNAETRMAQRLGDIQAGYQLPLIAKNQAALNEAKVASARIVAAAKQFILSNQ